MTTYEPNPTVLIDGGVSIPNNTISSIRISTGRRDVLEQPQAGYANLNFWTDADSPLDIELADTLQVQIDSALYGDQTRTNLIPNPSIETNTNGWGGVGGSMTLTRSTSFAKYGSASIRGVVDTTGTNRYMDKNQTDVLVTTGLTYTYSCWVYLPATNTADVTLNLLVYGWNGTGYSGSTFLDTKLVTRGTWTRLSGSFTSLTGTSGAATNALFRVLNQNSWAAGQQMYIDGALLEQSSTVNDYFDGSTLFPIVAAWTGTANASTSTLTGIKQTIFTGTISDITISLDAYGDIGSIARYNVTATGSLALLNRRIAGTSGYAKEFDGTRVYNILREAFVTEWDDLDNVSTWDDQPNIVTWANYDGANLALVDGLSTDVDVPGQYELYAYTDGETSALELAQTAADSGRGVLWEAADGSIHYDDYSARAFNTAFELTADDLLANGLVNNAQLGNIVNNVTIEYKANATQTARDDQSAILYGELAGTKATWLESGADALAQAEAYLESRSYPRVYPEELSIALHSPTVLDATRDALMAVYNGQRVSTSALPMVFGQVFDGFIEGWTWELTRYEAFLNLFCSAYSETYLSDIWLQVPQTTTWNSYNPTTTWENA